MKTKINSLESLRGLAALIVAMYHFPSTSFFFIPNGYLGVYFFFALSGFVIALNYFYIINSFKSLIKFQVKRFFRLYPIHIFVLFVVLGIQVLKLISLKFFNLSSGKEAFTPDYWYTLIDFFNHLFLVQAVIHNGYALSWNSAAWTISTEFYSYIVFGVITLSSRNNRFIFICISVLFIYFFNDISLLTKPYINHLFLGCLKFFLSGCIFFFIYEQIKIRLNDIFFIVLIFLLAYFYLEHLKLDNILFCTIILLVAILKEDSLISKFLNFSPFVYFGAISYSFYMIHQSVLYLYIQSLKFIFKVPFLYSDGIASNTGNVYYDTLITISYIVISAILASVMYRYIENKFRKKNNY